jgi:hypothetical protein
MSQKVRAEDLPVRIAHLFEDGLETYAKESTRPIRNLLDKE